MVTLTDLIQTRKTTKSRLTKFKTFVDSYYTKNSSLIELQARFNKVDGLLNEFIHIQNQIFVLNPGKEDADEIGNFEDYYYSIISAASQIINDETAVNSVRISPVENDNVVVDPAPMTSIQIRLPTIDLPSFAGAYDQWLPYRDSFMSLIHNNTSLTNEHKLFYLRSSLRGEPADSIQALQITGANFYVAWDILQKRYENTRLIVNNHLKAICNIPNQSKESSSGLRKIYNTVYHGLSALQSLNVAITDWDPLIIYLVTSKFDSSTSREWESFKFMATLPTLAELYAFINERCQMLELIKVESSSNKAGKPQPTAPLPANRSYHQPRNQSNVHVSTSRLECNFCKKPHLIYFCKEFLKLSIDDRIKSVKKLKLCLNCLRTHAVDNCQSGPCRKCNSRHNSLLHPTTNQTDESSSNGNTEGTPTDVPSQNCHTTSNSYSIEDTIVLGTAIIFISDKHGNKHKVRALLDSASQSSFIREDVVRNLGLPLDRLQMSIGGVNSTSSMVRFKSHIHISSCHSSFRSDIQCLVVKKISNYNTAGLTPDYERFNIPDDLKLADPTFYDVSNIDVLLGATLFYELLCQGQIKLGRQMPILQKTHFGWIIAGPTSAITNRSATSRSCHLTTTDNNEDILHAQIAKFWEIEELHAEGNHLSIEEEACETQFTETHQRLPGGRFMVHLPFKESASSLGNSRQQAERRLRSIERKLQGNKALHNEYHAFLKEYLTLGHMSKATDMPSPNFYLPHHAVFKSSSQTTKVRIVFDGSAKSDSGKSLNDILMVGPTLQDELFNIVLRFRKHLYVLTADISKMYRQILVHPADRRFLKVLWRPNNVLEEFELNTVTYGTGPASYLAIRCLVELAKEVLKDRPSISNIIQNDFYVDDVLTGADDEASLYNIYKELTDVLSGGGFELLKWCSNSNMFMKTIKQECAMDNSVLELGKHEEVKTLGIIWVPKDDSFQFQINMAEVTPRATKRVILSNIAKIFDPLGLVGPVITVGKIMMQKLWQLKVDWDESVPLDIYTQWNEFKEKLQVLNQLQIPRCIFPNNITRIELHGFSDASEQAYGACIYIRAITNGMIHANLLCSKSRVAPLKTATIPRLELSGAHLLALLSEKVQKALPAQFDRIIHWTDSTIVLSWLNKPPNSWKVFVANRVSAIQTLSKSIAWRHVRSADNPADIISRGIKADLLAENLLWWKGPNWLQQADNEWPHSCNELPNSNDIPEARSQIMVNLVTRNKPIDPIFLRYSSYQKLLRVTSYIQRFIYNSKSQNSSQRHIGELSPDNLKQARNTLARIVQAEAFAAPFEDLKTNTVLTKHKDLIALSPFIDDDQLIRVGGRLKFSHHSYDKRHPILLPQKHPFTALVIRYFHEDMKHAGPQLTLATIRQNFWPVGGRSQVRNIISHCITCFKTKPTNQANIMGHLPNSRIHRSLPFSICGLDYAGPYFIKDRIGRGSKVSKCYICVFVCFSTKAIHIELVGNLTTESFLGCLRRFTSRRGKPETIYSDNATNFVGARNELDQLTLFIENNSSAIINQATNLGIQWKFIPPRSPHFGGLWEAGVKALKFHLNRTLKDQILTYEELYTLLVQVESCLNSRPLCPLSNDPTDLDPLTPAHLLIGRNLTTVPNPSLNHIADNRLSRFQKIQQLLDQFWRRWYLEYLTELQRRTKWSKEGAQLELNQLVIIHEDNVRPNNWQLGRIIETHPGKDGRIRVVTVATSKGSFKRPAVKIYPLPLPEDEINHESTNGE